MKIKKGDILLVTVGKDKGRQAKVERIFPDTHSVLLPEINQYKKHRKAQGENRPGELLTLSRPINISKTALICPKCKQQTRVGFRFANEKKIRVCRKCYTDID